MPPPRNELETIDAIVEAGIWRQNWSHVAAPNRNGGQEMKLPSRPTLLSFNGATSIRSASWLFQGFLLRMSQATS
jgi:hypothetical protein